MSVNIVIILKQYTIEKLHYYSINASSSLIDAIIIFILWIVITTLLFTPYIVKMIKEEKKHK
jgi:hypothetical protein